MKEFDCVFKFGFGPSSPVWAPAPASSCSRETLGFICCIGRDFDEAERCSHSGSSVNFGLGALLSALIDSWGDG